MPTPGVQTVDALSSFENMDAKPYARASDSSLYGGKEIGI